MKFVPKLNRRKKAYVVSDEVMPLAGGRAAGFLQHDNVNAGTIEIYTRPQRGGERVLNYTAEVREDAEWKLWIQVFASEEQVYISYETKGDTVEANDINQLQAAVIDVDNGNRIQGQALQAHTEADYNPHGVTKEQVGLSQADNTADMDKPISTAQQKALDDLRVQLTKHAQQADNPHGVTKEQVGLSQADNTADVDKPISTAQKAELERITNLALESIAEAAAESRQALLQARSEIAADLAKARADITEAIVQAAEETYGRAAEALAAEAAARSESDGALQNVISTEAESRGESDALLQAAIDAEAAERSAGDFGLQESLSAVQGDVSAMQAELMAHEADSVGHITAGERQAWNDRYTKEEVDNKFSTLETAIDWKESVDTFDDIAAVYPQPEDGWTVNVKDTDYTYRYSGQQWVAISANAIPKATMSVDGLLTKEDKAALDEAREKLAGIEAGANQYFLPAASPSVLGGVKTGYVQNGRNYPVQLSEEQMYVTVPWTDTNTTYDVATTSKAGLMSAKDKAKLDGLTFGGLTWDQLKGV